MEIVVIFGPVLAAITWLLCWFFDGQLAKPPQGTQWELKTGDYGRYPQMRLVIPAKETPENFRNLSEEVVWKGDKSRRKQIVAEFPWDIYKSRLSRKLKSREIVKEYLNSRKESSEWVTIT